MRSVFVLLCAAISTPLLGLRVILAALFGVQDRPGGVYDHTARLWSRILIAAGGVRVVLHGTQHIQPGPARVFASNHVSWYDVFVLASVLPYYKFVAKAELLRLPIFGPAARAVGTIPIERENRKAAFAAYDEAASQIQDGASVVVFPEGTRGRDYPLRPFKKGPFVLAIAAQVPIVPTVVYGTVPILPRGSLFARPGTVHVHFLEPVSTAGLTYDDREWLSNTVRQRMAGALQEEYGVRSEPPPSALQPIAN